MDITCMQQVPLWLSWHDELPQSNNSLLCTYCCTSPLFSPCTLSLLSCLERMYFSRYFSCTSTSYLSPHEREAGAGPYVSSAEVEQRHGAGPIYACAPCDVCAQQQYQRSPTHTGCAPMFLLPIKFQPTCCSAFIGQSGSKLEARGLSPDGVPFVRRALSQRRA